MRLREITKILTDNVSKLNIIQSTISGTSNFNVSQLAEFRKGINNIAKTGLFKGEINLIKKLPAYASTIDPLMISSAENNKLSNLIASVKEGIDLFVDGVAEAMPIKDSENTISIKLPDKLDFENLVKIIELLKKSISIPLADAEVNDNIEIQAFESGSFWIDILVHSTEAVSLIAAVTWAGAFIYKQYLEAKIHTEYVESLKIKNLNLKDLQEGTKKQIDILIEVEALNLQNSYYNGDDPERLERLKLSIESMSKLIEKGTEIHPNLLASESLKSAFPPFKNLNLIESKTKQIKNE